MKKSLLTILSAALSLSAFSQATPSPDWATLQNTSFTVSAAGTRFLDAVSANDVWVIGYDGFAYKRNYNWFSVSNNGGSTFTTGNCYADTNTYVMANLDGVSGTTAWVSAYMKAGQNLGAVHQTTNSGVTWTDMTPAGAYTTAATSFVNVVCFVTPSVGIIMGDPLPTNFFEIYRTTNGGTAWTKVPNANMPGSLSGEYGTVNVYEKYGANDIWFGTTKNRIFHSTNGGLNWTASAALTSTLGAAQAIGDIAFSDANNGLVTAYFGTTTSQTVTLWNTTNGGASWTQIPTIAPKYGYNDMAGIKGSPGWYGSVSNGTATANQFLSYSMDNGVTWTDWNSLNIGYLALDFVDNISAWAGSFSSQVVIGTEGIYKYSGLPLGVENKAARPLAVSLYPNPSNGVFTIKMPPAKEGFVLTVFDVLGKQVYTHSGKTAGFETLSYDLSHLGKGIYSINIAKGNEMSTQKIVIE